MAVPDAITVTQLARLVGTPDAPSLLDVRVDSDYASDPRTAPTSVRRDYRSVSSWAGTYAGRSVVVLCQHGRKLSQGVVAWLRHAGARAEYLEGGFAAWVEAGGLLVRPEHVLSGMTRGAPSGSRAPGPRSIGSLALGSSAASSIGQTSFCSSGHPRSQMWRTTFGRPHLMSRTLFGVIAANSAPSM